MREQGREEARRKTNRKKEGKLGAVVHALNPRSGEAETDRSL